MEREEITNWNKRFMDMAKLIATWSKDKSTKVGAVIVDKENRVISIGYNGPPSGFPDNEEYIHERPTKYFYFEHAERNAIYNAVRIGVSTIGCTLYTTVISERNKNLFCCADCARAIVQAGIRKVVIQKSEEIFGDWADSTNAAKDIFNKCKVEVEFYERES